MNRQHRAPIDPFRLLWVEPDAIEKVSTRGYISHADSKKYDRAGAVVPGSWDTLQSYDTEYAGRLPKSDVDEDMAFSETYVWRALYHRFVRGGRWEDTTYYDLIRQEIEQGETLWGCSCAADLEYRCRYLDELYERIKRDGYRTQVEVQSPSNRFAEAACTIQNEIAVDIARDGELLFSDGRHRLGIAKILDLDVIPVVVLVRHERWQQFRDSVVTDGVATDALSPELRQHPDIEYLIDDDS